MAFLLIALVLIASYWREVIFLQINALLQHEPWNYSNTLPVAFLQNQPKETLLQLKWVLTGLFSVAIGGSTWICIQLMTELLWLKKLLNYVFALLLLWAGIMGSFYIFTPNKELFYPLLRISIGLFQTPLLLTIFGIILYAINNLSKLHNLKN